MYCSPARDDVFLLSRRRLPRVDRERRGGQRSDQRDTRHGPLGGRIASRIREDATRMTRTRSSSTSWRTLFTSRSRPRSSRSSSTCADEADDLFALPAAHRGRGEGGLAPLRARRTRRFASKGRRGRRWAVVERRPQSPIAPPAPAEAPPVEIPMAGRAPTLSRPRLRRRSRPARLGASPRARGPRG